MTAGHACCSKRESPTGVPGEGAEVLNCQQLLRQRSELIVGGGVQGRGLGSQLTPADPLAPPSCSGLCLVSTWLPKAGD